jgi:hypothetical protein
VGKWEKPKKKLHILPRKAQGETPLNRIGNKRLSKKNNQWPPIQKR